MVRFGLAVFVSILFVLVCVPDPVEGGPFGIRERIAARRAERMSARMSAGCSGSYSYSTSGCSGSVTVVQPAKVTRTWQQAPAVTNPVVVPVRTRQPLPVQPRANPSCPSGRCPTQRDFFTGSDVGFPSDDEELYVFYTGR